MLYKEYILSLLTINIIMYTFILYTIFSLFFIFDLKYIKTLSELKTMNYIESVSITLIISFLSLAGIPPLLGFVVKFCMFFFYILQTQYALLIVIILFNFFAMFFYIQNTRFVVSKEPGFNFVFRQNTVYIPFTLIKCLVFLNFLNLCGIFLYNDLYLFLNNIYCYLL